MTLPLESTLAEIRNDVAIRCGIASSGKFGAKSQPILDQFINQSYREIYTRAYWARVHRKLSINLADGVADYDIPDVTSIGGIHRVTVQSTTTPPREYDLKYDDVLEIQSLNMTNRSRPLYFQIENELIHIVPMADITKFAIAFIYCELMLTKLTDDADRVLVDSEAVIQQSTIRMRKYLGIGGDQKEERAIFERYMLDLRGLVAPNRSYPIASRNIDGPAYWKWPSTNGYSQPFTADWNPPGSW